jgi:hypothetical protein
MEAVPTTQTGQCFSGRRQIPRRQSVNGRDSRRDGTFVSPTILPAKTGRGATQLASVLFKTHTHTDNPCTD